MLPSRSSEEGATWSTNSHNQSPGFGRGQPGCCGLSLGLGWNDLGVDPSFKGVEYIFHVNIPAYLWGNIGCGVDLEALLSLASIEGSAH